MALKALMLKRQIEQKEKELEALREKSAELETREAELEKAIAEAETDEERSTVEEEVENFENEKSENDDATGKVEKELEDLKNELKDEEDKQVIEPTDEPKDDEAREVKLVMETREILTAKSSFERRMSEIVKDAEVKQFLDEIRTCVREKREIGNSELTIPRVMLPMLELKAVQYSKLLSRVNMEQVGGTARQVIMGVIPEAYWMEMCSRLSELDLGFNDVEMDGYKVGGFFAVCNAILEDNDVQLATRIVDALGKSIGKALDKAIVYGTGIKMPLGIVTRLSQEKQPADYPEKYRPWVDLHESHIIKGSGATGIGLFKETLLNTKVLENDYFENGLTWVMNKGTHTDFLANSMDKNMNAAIVAGMNNSMPVAGGDVVELPFMNDGDYVVGYFDAYLLAQRAGTKIGQSEHVRFIDDQTVFKGTARYDGTPVIPEAFLIGNIYNNVAPTLVVPFPEAKSKAN